MMSRITPLFVILLVLTIAEIINGVRHKPNQPRWRYCHEKAHIDGVDLHECLDEYGGICKSGKNQSPINIVKDAREKIKLKDPFKFSTNSKVFRLLKVVNNGHSVQLTPDKKPAEYFTMSGGGLNGNYEFWQAHMHWGSRNGLGSEHTIDGKHYAMEMHLVFWNKKFENASLAMESNESDALAVLAVLYEVDDKNKKLDPIFDTFKDVLEEEGHKDYKDGFSVRDLLPKKKDLKNFYRYHGSLTTPDCNEVVVWTIFKKKMEISKKQMKELRQLRHGIDNEPRTYISNNYRDAQPLNDRKVYYYKIKKGHNNDDDDDDDDDDK